MVRDNHHFIRAAGSWRVCWSGHVHDTELMCLCGCGWEVLYICQIINKFLDKDHMCASLCTSPTSLPHVPFRAGAKRYQQECWDCLVSSGDIMAGCPVQQGSLSTTFLLVASATQSQAVDQCHPLQQYESFINRLQD